MTSHPVRQRVPLPGISSRAWEHPADKGALVALRKLKGFDTLLKRLSGLFNERAVRLQYLGSAIRVDERQYPFLHVLLLEAATGLDAQEVPELYVVANPFPNAVTIGMDKPIIVVTSGLVDLLDEEEMRFVLGHEVGHALSGHAVYQTLLIRALTLSGALLLLSIAIRLIIAALMEWSRKAELSADRAGLLATQDPAVAFRVHMKLASGGQLEHLDTPSFFAQGQEYDASGDLRDSLLKLLLVERATHPFTVVRASELRKWVDSGAYTRVLSGDYPRREDDDSADMSEAAQEAARHYAEAFRQSQDALTKLLRDLSGLAGSVRDWMGGAFGNKTNGDDDNGSDGKQN
ncbi:MAG: M48 family metallopeptidase [Nocardioidaceae bacterium]|nr:M48 family metallopeptidase [Nocardioidaceae bacterium]NUS50227.1 M48 family metallopeptidase [Nocardioidaceae bacterium]